MSPSEPACNSTTNPVVDDSALIQPSRIFLTGYMGTGKSTIGKILANRLGRQFYDTDRLVVRGFGNKSVSQIFQEYGEEAFRKAENQIVQELCKRENFVASAGGGTLVREETLSPALESGAVVYLYTPVETLFERVIFSGKDRPILEEPDTEERFREKYLARQPYYERAHLTVPTHTLDRDDIVSSILRALHFPA